MEIRALRTLGLLYLPAFACLALAFALDVTFKNADTNPFLGALAQGFAWLELLSLAAAAVLLLQATWRYAQWEKGNTIGCCRCGGLLGRIQRGRYGSFQRCLACGEAERSQH
jgi:hypothetical protein